MVRLIHFFKILFPEINILISKGNHMNAAYPPNPPISFSPILRYSQHAEAITPFFAVTAADQTDRLIFFFFSCCNEFVLTHFFSGKIRTASFFSDQITVIHQLLHCPAHCHAIHIKQRSKLSLRRNRQIRYIGSI